MAFFKLDFDSMDRYVGNHLRLFTSMAIGIIIFVGIVALAIFFAAVRGAEQTMVPDVRGQDLTEALMELQVKELYPRIVLRYSQSAQDRGMILEQEPAAGTIVKAGRRIRLVVSRGVLLSSIGDYLGRGVDDVRLEIQALNAAAGQAQPLLSLKEPFMYEYSDKPAGTILEQTPVAGTGISGPAELAFVVSRGPENAPVPVPKLAGLTAAEAAKTAADAGFSFSFRARPIREGETAGAVVWQDPAADTPSPSGSRITLTVGEPAAAADAADIFGVFAYTLPKNPYPLPVKLEAVLPSGGRAALCEADFPGGEFTFPYQVPPGSELVLSVMNRELYREKVTPPEEPPPAEALPAE